MNFNRGGRDSQRVNEKDLATELRQIIGEENVLTDSYSRGNKRVIKIPAREFVDRRRNKSSKFPIADACLNWTHASLEWYRSSRGSLAVLPSNVRNTMSSKLSCYTSLPGESGNRFSHRPWSVGSWTDCPASANRLH